jgi:2-methylcitrate dehydratase PrpD
MPPTPEQAIARHIATCSERQLPEEAIVIAKRSIVDGMAALVAGRRAEGIDEMLSLAERWGGTPEARIYGTGRRTSSPTAAWLNGAQMRALELDDCTDTLPLHPTAALLPALLAAVDLSPMSGADLVRALIIAQDLKIRFGLAITRNAMQSGRNNVFRIFAAAAGVAAALRLDEQQTLHALGISASYGAGDAQCILDGSMALRVQFGNTAHGALHSCLLAKNGVTGPGDFLLGRYGYLNAFEPEHDLDPLLSALGTRFENTRIAVKPYASCRGTHAAIDLALTIRSTHGSLGLEDVDRIDITVSPEVYQLVGGPREAKLRPETSSAAQFSLHFMVATALLTGRAGLAATQLNRLTDSRTLTLADRIHVAPDESCRTRDIVGCTRFVLHLSSGAVIELSNDRPSGGSSNSISRDTLRAKLEDCVVFAGRTIWPNQLDRFIERVDAIQAEPSASALFDDFA